MRTLNAESTVGSSRSAQLQAASRTLALSTNQRRRTTTMDIKRKLAVGTVGILGLMGAGGVALAQSSSPPTTTPPAQSTPVSSNAKAEAPEPTGPDTDNIQEGDQNGPDGPEAADANEKPGTETPDANEKPGTENPADDAPGQAATPAGK
jgi:hypothetical protein